MGNDVPDARPGIALRLRDLWSWWRSALAAVVPQGVRNALSRPPRLVSIGLLAEGYGLSDGNGAPASAEAGQTLTDVMAIIRDRKRRWGPLLYAEIVVPLSKCLVLDREIPVRALPRVDGILALELSRKTPFGASHLYSGHYILSDEREASGTLQVRLVATKRSLVEPLLDELAKLSVPLSAIAVEPQKGTRLPVNLLPAPGPKGAGITARLDRLIYAGAAATVCLALVVIGGEIWRQTATLAGLEGELASVRKQAVAVRRQLSDADAALARAQALRRHKHEAVKNVEIWEEVTRLLPATVWLTQIQRDNDTVQLLGSASSASELIRTLSRSPLFSKVEFTSPITRDGHGNTERFQIRLGLNRKVAAGVKSGHLAKEVAP